MLCRVDRKMFWAFAAVTAWSLSGAAWGQEGSLPPAPGAYGGPPQAQQGGNLMTFDDIRARLEEQDMEIRQLKAQLAQQPQGASTTAAGYADPLANAAAPAPAAGATGLPPGATVVGSNLSGIVFFKDGEFLNFSTPNKDFTMHLGGWVQWDNVWWAQPAAMSAAQTPKAGGYQQPAVASSNAGGGIGTLEDGDYWRRLRIVQEGTFWETGEYRFNWALETLTYGTTGLDEMWVGQNDIPVIGSVRVGHVKDAIGLEGDMTSSSRCMTFMERSAFSEAIELNQNFVTGLWLGSSYLDDRVTYQAVAFRPDNGNSGDFFGDGESGVQARLTCLPLYEDEGRHLLHLAVSGGWRNGANNLANANYTGNEVTLQARPELRDDDPAGGGGGTTSIVNANDDRMISTGALACDNEYLAGLEMLYIRGPFSLQAEYGWNWLNNASGINPASTPAHPILSPASDYMFNGGYVQVAYTLTGENRAYDKKSGCLSRYYFGTPGPYERAYITRDENGGICWGRGAWEIAARYTYTDLNSGVGTTKIDGGIMDGFGVALNWYANTNLTVDTEWVWNNRYALPTGSVPGAVSAMGIRVQFSF